MRLAWYEDAWEDYVWWQTQDRKALKRINALIKDTQRSPYELESRNRLNKTHTGDTIGSTPRRGGIMHYVHDQYGNTPNRKERGKPARQSCEGS